MKIRSIPCAGLKQVQGPPMLCWCLLLTGRSRALSWYLHLEPSKQGKCCNNVLEEQRPESRVFGVGQNAVVEEAWKQTEANDCRGRSRSGSTVFAARCGGGDTPRPRSDGSTTGKSNKERGRVFGLEMRLDTYTCGPNCKSTAQYRVHMINKLKCYAP